jgi:hypothetical protein
MVASPPLLLFAVLFFLPIMMDRAARAQIIPGARMWDTAPDWSSSGLRTVCLQKNNIPHASSSPRSPSTTYVTLLLTICYPRSRAR